MLAHATIIMRVRNCNNMLQPEHYVLVIIFDQCFEASLLMEGIESNYIALPLRCYSKSIMFLILFLLLLQKRTSFITSDILLHCENHSSFLLVKNYQQKCFCYSVHYVSYVYNIEDYVFRYMFENGEDTFTFLY